ncbi:hypothetical protein EC973_004597 [Apophysomyces ossiformis]|uniref:YCII-related domain-containing protein n=1 Tax=Apophysomyces ossiformis TaxID=679940 RepID=A0A8H7BWS7_9FUNG|nr:hypothetical protein EC973_004597 [Apophysomyces ossiformis]
MEKSDTRKQFVVVIHDYTDPNALERRMASREAHLAWAKEARKTGDLVCGGAIFDNHENRKMVGSVMICRAESREALEERIANDPYTLGKAWEKWDIYPYRNAIGLEDELPYKPSDI